MPSSDRDIEPAFAALVQREAGALVVAASRLFDCNRDQLVALAARHKIPAIYHARESVLDGGLMSYGSQLPRSLSPGRSLCRPDSQGRKPADLPVQQATNFEFVINLKTAKALGLEMPPCPCTFADEVIE